jgi:hypothetical protein
MATYYFLGGGTAPTDWDDSTNWYDAPSGGTSGQTPTSGDDVVISSPVDTASSTTPTVNTTTIDSGGIITAIDLYSPEVTLQNGGKIGGFATVYGDVTCDNGGIIGHAGDLVYINGILSFAGTGQTESGISANIADVSGNIYITGSGPIDWIATGGDLIYQSGYTSTVGSNLTIAGGTFYTNYSTLYYNAAVSNDWHNNLNWWIDSSYTQQSYDIPSNSDDVIIGGSIYNTTTDMYCNNATINYSLTMSTPYALNVASTLTVSDTYYIGDSMYAGPDIICTNAIFNGNSYVTGNTDISASGTVTFNSTSELGHSNYGGANITGDVVFNDSSEFISGTITGNASFYGTSVFTGGTVTLNVTVYYDHPAPFSYTGTINGTLSYSGYPARTVYFYHTSSSEDWGGNFWYSDSAHMNQTTPPNPTISKDDVLVEASVGSNTGSLDTTIRDLTVTGVVVSNPFINIDITCDSAFFRDFSYLTTSATLTQSSGVAGNITFNDSSNNQGTINNYNPVIFQSTSSNDGTINGDVDVYYPSEKPVGGTVTGFVTYYGYTLYFGGPMNDGDWSTVGNWYLDFANASGYGAVPSEIMPYQNVIVQNNITSNTSSNPSVYDISTTGSYPYISIAILVTNLATLSDETYLDSTAVVSGNALFQNLATNRGGTITGTGTFTLSSAEQMISNGYDGTYADIEFQYGKGVNGSNILGIV